MSFIIGKYYGGDPREKPDQWGPASDVQAAIRENAAGMGWPILGSYVPFWEKAGLIAHDFGIVPTNWTLNDGNLPTWGNGGIVFNNTQDNSTAPISLNTNEFFYSDVITDITVGCRVTFDADTGGPIGLWGIGGFWNGVSLFYKTTPNTFAVNISASGNDKITETTTTYTPNGQTLDIVIVLSSNAILIYVNGKLVKTDSYTGTINNNESAPELGLAYAQSNMMDEWGGTFKDFWATRNALTADQIAYKYEHPYALIQPITRRFYSIPSGAGDVIAAACTDGFTFADSATKTAILQAAAIESINLSDSDENIAQFIAALVDSFAMVDLSGNTAKYPVSVSDAFSVSDSTTALQKVIALVSDNVTFSDVSVVRADLTGIAEDNVQFAETLLANLHAQAVASEIINLSDSVNAELLGNLLAYVTDTFNMSDSTTARADLVALITDAFDLSYAATNTLQAYATAEDGFTVSDIAFWAGVTQAIASDSFTVSGSVTGLIKLFAQAAETINFSDSGSVTATYNVQVNDAVEFATAISTIAQFRAAISDGFNVTATAMEVSQLPNGKVSVSFSMKTATVVFNIK